MFEFTRMLVRYSLSAVVLAAAAAVAQAQEKWDMPAAYSGQNYVSKSYIAFAEAVTANSNGALEIVVHPAGSLYKGAEILRAVRSGQVPIGGRYMGAHAKEDPIFGMDVVPFLASDFDAAWDLYQTSKPAIESALSERGMKLLYMPVWPPQGLFSKNQVTTMADMKGTKFRAADANTSRLAVLMGATPTKTEATEISQAFSTGVADSMMGSGAIGVFQKMWDNVDYFYTVNAWIPKSAVIVNADAWADLDDATKQVVMDAAAKAEADVWQAAKDITDSYNATMAENGMTVAPPSKQLKSEFSTIGAKMATEWAENAGEAGTAALVAFKASN
ncbi:TRAP transporter substrate-binding protein [Pelagibius sp. Alg239-R121]|uniref:TRAP transporter substrate-binding protein n=1 Tax=Pelagibius sp. Alg239-R121 TaxID=2993448 RepID=UPI0024A6CC86|nr:TRAP transporter substrate-binding protein [Pelagibius sp. Alg239-R121]